MVVERICTQLMDSSGETLVPTFPGKRFPPLIMVDEVCDCEISGKSIFFFSVLYFLLILSKTNATKTDQQNIDPGQKCTFLH